MRRVATGESRESRAESASKGGAVVRALASHQMNPGVDAMWFEIVAGSLPCSERFFSGYLSFLLASKTNTSKFQFDLERTDTIKTSSQ